MTRPRVLMVTGVYDPETSGASLQCRQLVARLRDRADFVVLTTSAHAELPRYSHVDGVEVRRVYVDPARPWSKAGALVGMLHAFASLAPRVDIVHVHGFSQKTILLLSLARLAGKKTVMKLTSFGHDDALTMRKAGGTAWARYRAVDRAIAVSPALGQAWTDAGLDPGRLAFVPNGVDADRFHPVDAADRSALRHELGWPTDVPVVLFVGFFSPEKRPDLLYRVWAAARERGLRSTLVLVGATASRYHEIDPSMAGTIRDDAKARGLSSSLVFIERTDAIERCYRAADVFALPTTREGLPNVLLESMASGVPPVVSRLPGVTDWIIEDGVTGRLVAPEDEADFGRALESLLADEAGRQTMGVAARAHVCRTFSAGRVADETMAIYETLLGTGRAA